MKEQKVEAGSQKSKKIQQKYIHILKIYLVCLLISAFCSLSAFAEEKWTGVDEAVVEKIAKEHGREKQAPFINTDQGDLLLFVFLIAGTIGGFAAGYYWRIIMVERAQKINKEKT
jgi:ABC-type cobalt transport system substrate-binding protein